MIPMTAFIYEIFDSRHFLHKVTLIFHQVISLVNGGQKRNSGIYLKDFCETSMKCFRCQQIHSYRTHETGLTCHIRTGYQCRFLMKHHIVRNTVFYQRMIHCLCTQSLPCPVISRQTVIRQLLPQDGNRQNRIQKTYEAVNIVDSRRLLLQQMKSSAYRIRLVEKEYPD